MLRLVVGIVKGLLAGIAVGIGAWYLGIKGGVLAYIAYGAIGALVGLICGKAPWKQETLWTPALKAAFGFGVGAGLYALWVHFMPTFEMPVAHSLGAPAAPMAQVPYLLGPVIGLLYGAFVEVDDGGGSKKPDVKVEKKA
jgi:hypothetical protein